MEEYLLLIAVVIVCCVVFYKISDKIGVPMLLAFIILGMLFGTDGLIRIDFNNYEFAEEVCSVALIFIMFYGGFGTNWEQARSVAKKAIVLSSLGTILTAGLVGAFCHFVLKIPLLESFLLGSVISSTDAASVFSILRSKRLNLRDNTASLLEIESGSNDPFSYMLTVICLSLMKGGMTPASAGLMFLGQIIFGILFGVIIAQLTVMILKKDRGLSTGFETVFIAAVALFAYAIPSAVGGNGYLSVYITGIILGNHKITNKVELVHFFDATTTLMQMLLFFLLGLLSMPSRLPYVAGTAIFVALFLTLVARPAAIFALLTPFKSRLNQQLLVSWAGMRGAASIVFSIMVVTGTVKTDNDIFHIIFFVVLFSILLQGTLVPFVSKRLDMIDADVDVMKTFNDYMENTPIQFIQFELKCGHAWIGKKLKDILLPPNSLIVLIVRNHEKCIPDGTTVLCENDMLILSGETTSHTDSIHLYKRVIDKDDEWLNQIIANISMDNDFIIAINRKGEYIIPSGNTHILEGDVLMITDKSSL